MAEKYFKKKTLKVGNASYSLIILILLTQNYLKKMSGNHLKK